MAGSQGGRALPTQLGLAQFEQFVFPHLSIGRRGPAPKLGLHKIFNYILRLSTQNTNVSVFPNLKMSVLGSSGGRAASPGLGQPPTGAPHADRVGRARWLPRG